MVKGYYQPGIGRTFTPSSDAQWIDAFNKIIDRERISRNKLTDELIEMGLKYKHMFKGNDDDIIFLPVPSHLSEEQKGFLKSSFGKNIILNIVSMILNNGNALNNGVLSIPVVDQQNNNKKSFEFNESVESKEGERLQANDSTFSNSFLQHQQEIIPNKSEQIEKEQSYSKITSTSIGSLSQQDNVENETKPLTAARKALKKKASMSYDHQTK